MARHAKQGARIFKGARGALVSAVLLAGALAFVAVWSGGPHSSGPDLSEDARDANWSFPEATVVESSEEGLGDADTEIPVVALDSEGDELCVANEVLVTFDGGVDERGLREALADSGVDVADVSLVSKSLDDGEVLTRVSYEGDEDPDEVVDILSDNALVTSAEPNYLLELDDAEESSASFESDGVELQAWVNDPAASQQWGLDSVDASVAWDYVKSEGRVTVAVLDSGVDYDHPDLAENLILGKYAKNIVSNEVGGRAVDDTLGHGTHVAGIVSAVANNGVGVAGVSYNAKILPVKTTCNSEGGMLTSDLIEALDYVVSLKSQPVSELNAIRVVNMSLGGPRIPRIFKRPFCVFKMRESWWSLRLATMESICKATTLRRMRA